MRAGLVLVGTFLPVIGVGATALFAAVTSGTTRWIILAGLPALSAGLSWLLIDPVWTNGNLLAAAIYLGFFAALLAYYPLLLAMGAITFYRARRRAD